MHLAMTVTTRRICRGQESRPGLCYDSCRSKKRLGDKSLIFTCYSQRFSQVPYHDVLMDFPFKGDETPLREMEHTELITIGTYNGKSYDIPQTT
jgi:hypothetical protein